MKTVVLADEKGQVVSEVEFEFVKRYASERIVAAVVSTDTVFGVEYGGFFYVDRLGYFLKFEIDRAETKKEEDYANWSKVATEFRKIIKGES